MEDSDTICAVSTAPGEGGIGIIRMSGSSARSILRNIFKAKNSKKSFLSRKLYLGHIINPRTKQILDEVFAVFMAAPHTYTREDVAEVYSHGGLAVQRSILGLMMEQGARLAEPGEFTKRAYLNGRIDLSQAEAVLDIIRSETEEELEVALEHLQGKLSVKLKGLKDGLKNALVEIEAQIDFPEEEMEIDEKSITAALARAGDGIRRLISSYYAGHALKDGFEVLIVCRTNVGKSSLLNALLAKEKAIVTPLPGTTRDLVEETLHIHGVKVKIIDTAGLRAPADAAEEAGIGKVRQKIPQVDLVLWVMDGSLPFGREDAEIFHTISSRTVIAVVNKVDLPRLLVPEAAVLEGLRRADVSALTDEGIDGLREILYEMLMGKGLKAHGGVLVTNMRHREALAKAQEAVGRSVACIRHKEPLEFTAFELREALLYIGEITGETCTEEILHEIFDRFCIGK